MYGRARYSSCTISTEYLFPSRRACPLSIRQNRVQLNSHRLGDTGYHTADVWHFNYVPDNGHLVRRSNAREEYRLTSVCWRRRSAALSARVPCFISSLFSLTPFNRSAGTQRPRRRPRRLVARDVGHGRGRCGTRARDRQSGLR
jgi:hypothetical protein